jgi:6-pyruvoyltetrahydropterin/6-carboxytetrahydropterin synthase
MSSTSITLSFRWPMGHRILGLTGGGAKCRNIHGHNWVADVELPNDTGALEFGAVKAAIGDWIDAELDHGFALHADDDFLDYLREHDLKHIALSCPPTTEAITALIADKTYELVGVRPVRVHVMEGYRNAATWYDS